MQSTANGTVHTIRGADEVNVVRRDRHWEGGEPTILTLQGSANPYRDEANIPGRGGVTHVHNDEWGPSGTTHVLDKIWGAKKGRASCLPCEDSWPCVKDRSQPESSKPRELRASRSAAGRGGPGPGDEPWEGLGGEPDGGGVHAGEGGAGR